VARDRDGVWVGAYGRHSGGEDQRSIAQQRLVAFALVMQHGPKIAHVDGLAACRGALPVLAPLFLSLLRQIAGPLDRAHLDSAALIRLFQSNPPSRHLAPLSGLDEDLFAVFVEDPIVGGGGLLHPPSPVSAFDEHPNFAAIGR
jgi:hypothetical protein